MATKLTQNELGQLPGLIKEWDKKYDRQIFITTILKTIYVRNIYRNRLLLKDADRQQAFLEGVIFGLAAAGINPDINEAGTALKIYDLLGFNEFLEAEG